MGDLDASLEATWLPFASRLRLVEAAMVLSDLVNQYDRKLDLHWETLLHNAYEILAVKRASEEVPDMVTNEKQYVKFVIGIMTDLAEQLIDGRVQRFATDKMNLNKLDRKVHAKELVARLEDAILHNDEEAKRIWPLIVKHTSLEIDMICGFQPGKTDTIKKRIYRRSETFLRGVLYFQEPRKNDHDSQI